ARGEAASRSTSQAQGAPPPARDGAARGQGRPSRQGARSARRAHANREARARCRKGTRCYREDPEGARRPRLDELKVKTVPEATSDSNELNKLRPSLSYPSSFVGFRNHRVAPRVIDSTMLCLRLRRTVGVATAGVRWVSRRSFVTPVASVP